MTPPFDTLTARAARFLWRLLWTLGLPLALLYLWKRGRKDAGYRRHIGERFGGGAAVPPGAIWIHAVSLGEVRSAVPLVQALLARKEHVVFTHGSPSGRREVVKVFADDIVQGRVFTRYQPVEQRWAYRRFMRRVRPKLGLVMEVEFWPVMIEAARTHGVPIMLCNGQYPGKSFANDPTWRKAIPSGFTAVMVKSEMMAQRFCTIGCPSVHITGEMRFEQPLPQDQIAAGQAIKAVLTRPVITLSSVVAGEDDVFIPAIHAAPALFIYVPRAPERFEHTYTRLQKEGFKTAKRSDVFTDDFTTAVDLNDLDVIVGNSLGEMYFYLSMADHVIIGGGFTPKASHNIIESLAVGKPVAVGPAIHTIEYPGVEAIESGVCTHLQTPQDVIDLCLNTKRRPPAPAGLEAFMAAHGGAVAKTLATIDHITNR